MFSYRFGRSILLMKFTVTQGHAVEQNTRLPPPRAERVASWTRWIATVRTQPGRLQIAIHPPMMETRSRRRVISDCTEPIHQYNMRPVVTPLHVHSKLPAQACSGIYIPASQRRCDAPPVVQIKLWPMNDQKYRRCHSEQNKHCPLPDN